MGCVQCKDKEATKLTEERDGSLSQSTGYRYGTDPTPQHYPSFGVTSIPNYNNFHAAAGQGLTVFGGVNSSSHTGTLRTRGGTGKPPPGRAGGSFPLPLAETPSGSDGPRESPAGRPRGRGVTAALAG